MCNIVHVQPTKSSNFSLKNNNNLLKNSIFNIKCTKFQIKFTNLNFLTCVNLYMIKTLIFNIISKKSTVEIASPIIFFLV